MQLGYVCSSYKAPLLPAAMPPTATPPAGLLMPGGSRVPLESPVSSEMCEDDESPEADLDYLDEYDSDEDRKQKKKKKVRGGGDCKKTSVVLQLHVALEGISTSFHGWL